MADDDVAYPDIDEAEARAHAGEYFEDASAEGDLDQIIHHGGAASSSHHVPRDDHDDTRGATATGADSDDDSYDGEAFDPMAGLDEYQVGKFKRFRETVDSMPDLTPRERAWADDMCLLRYLRAREWKLKKAIPMFNETLQWRREFKPWTIRPEDVEPESVTGKNYRFGKDMFGRPAIIMTPARENTDTHERQVRLTVYILERAIEEMSRKRGVESIVLIIDNDGFTMRNAPPMKVSKQVLHILSNHYPERLGLALCVDAPFYFKMFYNIIKPFINKVTARKIVFVSGSTEPGSKKVETLSKIFDMSQLEKRFGGTSEFTYVHEHYWPRETEQFYRRHTEADWAE